MRRALPFLSLLPLGLTFLMTARVASAADPIPIDSFSRSNTSVRLSFTPRPAIQSYEVQSTRDLGIPFGVEAAGLDPDFFWLGASDAPSGFYRVMATPLSDDALLTANMLNRIAYGPTPDDLDRILTGAGAIGPQGYIQEQLAPESIPEDIDTQPPQTGWMYMTATGTAGSGRFYFYLSGPGSVLIDDVKLVKGSVAESGANILANGGFETALAPSWVATANFAGSVSTNLGAHSGSKALLLVATAAGSGSGNALYQNFSGYQAGQVYTLSFWYFATNQDVTLTGRLSGADSAIAEHEVAPTPPPIAANYSRLLSMDANLHHLRAWFTLHAVESRRQLLEVLSQFWENHFVTEHSKTVDYFDRYYDDFDLLDRIATNLEFRELTRWREAMLKPGCTFRDLLKISAESPAQIIYLDTVGSRGDGSYIANENYSRELLELYTFGVDNGYDQADIVTMSRAWTGWTVRLVDPDKINDPFALQSTNYIDPTLTNTTALTSISNLVGSWSFYFRSSRHNTREKLIFPGKTVPARFGAPWAGRPYQLRLVARTGNDGIKDGQAVVDHLSDQPFTQEFISVKLCRLFVHDDFQHGVYDYRDPDLSEEGKLVHQCMLAWENGSPKGQLRQVLKVIFDSDLFRRQGGSMQKVKTPLEFCVSAVRALRSDLGEGRYSASTDGYSISGRSRTASSSPLVRMGVMRLFDRMEPDGYTELAPGWISGGTLAERSRFVQSLLMSEGDAAKDDGISGGNHNLSDPSALVRSRIPQSLQSDAATVASYFLGILFPGEGAGNLAGFQATAVRFLDTSDDGLTSSPFRLLSQGSAAYDTRVRAMVSLLMMSPRFEEQ